MSGGAFDYYQYHIDEIVARIEYEIERATCERPSTHIIKYVSVWEMTSENSSYWLHNHVFKECQDLDDVRKLTRKMKKSIKVLEDKGDRIIFEESGRKRYVYAGQYEEYDDVYDEDGCKVDVYYPDYTAKTIAEFRKGVEILKKASVYAQRIDWFISGDDGEDSFHKRLEEELKALEDI